MYYLMNKPPMDRYVPATTQTGGDTINQINTGTEDMSPTVPVSYSDQEYTRRPENFNPRNRAERRLGSKINSKSKFIGDTGRK